MTIPAVRFGPTALSDLVARTYEAWLLEAVYDIADQRLAVENKDQLVYPPSGTQPAVTIFGVGNINLGDWRPGFLAAGAPLVFITGFKLLDMLLEWVLVENDHKPTYRFEQKIAALKGSIQYPDLIGSRPWLQERLVALYATLEPLRGTIIHECHFRSIDGGVEVSSSKAGTLGPIIAISTKDLRNLALLLVSLLRYIVGTWTIDAFGEKRVRFALDELAHLHSIGSLGQLLPGFLNVRVYVSESDSFECDLQRIRLDIAATWPNNDMMFDLRVISVASDGSHATAYLIPWSHMQDSGPLLKMATADLKPFAAEVPTELDLGLLATQLSRREGVAP